MKRKIKQNNYQIEKDIMKNKIRIGNAGGFWGDDLGALKRQLTGGPLNYITTDYLAEITMSILRKQQLKNPKLGYITDFVDQMDDVAEIAIEKGVTIIVNAGGINPLECAKQVTERLKAKKLSMKIAIIEGDNIVDEIPNLYPQKADFKNLEDGSDFVAIKDKVQSANVYLGVQPIVKALKEGAQLIIAGRVTDTSITLAPMIYEFEWQLNDWDKLAAGIVAGHIIECGAQSSGGNFTDWEKVPGWENFGYPIVEMYSGGDFIVTKHENTGGLVSVDTVKEQIVYEMGNPKEYISPDVIADFQTINIQPNGKDSVKIAGIKGKPSTKTYKVSMAYEDGFKASGTIIISGPNPIEKAEKFAEIFWKRLNIDFTKRNHELVGYNACHKNLVENKTANEVLLKLDVFDYSRSKIEEFSKSIAPLILSGPPGVAVTGGRPRVQSVMTYWPALLSKALVQSKVSLINEQGGIENSYSISEVTGFEEDLTKTEEALSQPSERINSLANSSLTIKKTYKDICLARSGDKGDTVNIGVVARTPEIYQFIKEKLTENEIKRMFKAFCKGNVKRYELDNIYALNFLLEKSLDGGGTKSLMIDAQGKTFASAFLSQKVDVPEILLET
jgi:hypothetical protein